MPTASTLERFEITNPIDPQSCAWGILLDSDIVRVVGPNNQFLGRVGVETLAETGEVPLTITQPPCLVVPTELVGQLVSKCVESQVVKVPPVSVNPFNN